MKSFLIFLLVQICTATFGQSKALDQKNTLTKIIARKFASNKDDSLRITKFCDSLHKKYEVRKIFFANDKTGYSYFRWPFRKMLIDTTKYNTNFVDVYDEWIGELVHAKQFSEKPFLSLNKSMKGFFRTAGRVIFHKKDYREKANVLARKACCKKIKAFLWTAYRDEYYKKGSFEYEAHEIIEPTLKKFFLQKVQTKSLASL